MRKSMVVMIGMVIVGSGVAGLSLAETKPSADVFERACGKCHSVNRAMSQTKTRRDWEKIFTRMMKKLELPEFATTNINQDEAKEIVDYLVAERGYKNSQASKAEERKEELLKKAASSDSQENKAEERKAELLKKMAENGAPTAEERKAKLFEKFTPTKARTVSKKAKTVNQED